MVRDHITPFEAIGRIARARPHRAGAAAAVARTPRAAGAGASSRDAGA